MSLNKILKLLAAFFMSQGVTLVGQLLVPPLFLRRYGHGIEMYGEWVALTAAISYLATLNFGVQTYANNQMTLHYNRGELEEAKVVQSTALRLMLMMVLIALIVGVAILFMPLARWMGLQHLSSSAASWTLFFMVLQLVANWFFAFLSNSYMVIGELHRGTTWQNAQRLTGVLALACFLWFRASFPVLALAQLGSLVIFVVIVLIEIRLRAPVLLPSLRYGSAKDIMGVLKPSAYYGLLALSTFFAWQGPLLLIQKILGPTAVAIFALSRTVFSMSRQLLIVLTYSIGQETITIIARKSWAQLLRMYDLSERVILLLVPVVTVGTYLASPFLFTIWLHKRALYNPEICLLMAIVSAIMGIKEHKYQFQYLSNEHQAISRFSLMVYAAMIVAAAITLKWWGIDSFMILWMTAEILITGFIMQQNRKLFPPEFHPSLAPIPRLATVLAIAFSVAAWAGWHGAQWPLTRVVLVAVGAALGLGIVCYFVFGLAEVQAVFQNRLRRRFASAAQ